MNYRHIFHAGNFADTFKHIVLMLLTQSFLRKETAFCYLDTHAGIGHYNLLTEPAQKTKEYENGITKIIEADNKPEMITEYINLILSLQNNNELSSITLYPGSPEIVRHFLRPTDRMMLCELHPEDYATLKKNMGHKKQIAIHHQDGYQSLKALLPPKEKRGLVLIDPPYENTNEFSQLLTTLPQALKRFETGVYAIWYPIKDRKSIDAFYRALKEKIARPMLACELTIYPDNLATHLNGSGMLIINPPYQIDQQIQDILPWLWETVSTNKQGHSFVKFL